MVELFSENLRILREQLDISQAKLAKKLEVSTGSIVQYENGTRTPNYNFILQLNKNLNINLNWFVTGEGEMFNKKEPVGLKDEIKQAVREMIASGELKNEFK